MVKYICSSSEIKSDYARSWLEQNLVPKTEKFCVQSGYFSYSAIDPFINILENIVKKGHSVKLVLGSNDGSLPVDDAKSVFKILKGKVNCRLTIVALGNAEFHPKCYAIIQHDKSKTALVGSQNLTFPGTAKNFEAGIILNTNDGDSSDVIDKIIDSIEKWSTATEIEGAFQINTIKDLDDLKQSKIIGQSNIEAKMSTRKKLRGQRNPKKQIQKNVKLLWSQKRKPRPGHGSRIGSGPINPAVLIAEIPNASGRWNQANFDKNSYQNYFGFTIGSTQYISLQHVNNGGILGETENRPGVSVKSMNYRVELSAARGLVYPSGSRPIAIFVRDTPTTFRYCLLMPRDPGFQIMLNYLIAQLGNPGHRMRRMTTDYLSLKTVWPSTPL